MMALLTELFGTAALFSTLLLYLTEIPMLKQLVITKSAQGVQYSAILMNLVNNVVALYYAILSSTDVMKITNGVGTVLHIILCLAFILVSERRGGAISSSVGAVAFVAGAGIYLDKIQGFDERLDALGLLSTVICSLAFFIPIMAVVEAWTSRNPAAISIPITWGSLICSSVWWIYGILLDNIFIQLPNIPGVAVSLAALMVVWLLGDQPKTAAQKKEN